MRVSCLAGGGRDGTGTWFVLRWKSVTFVVDAPVAPEHATPEDAVQAVTYKLGKKDPKAISPVQQATVNPFDHVDPEEVDVVLVSSYESLLGAYSFLQAEGFHGQVFASDPSVQFGKMLRRCAARAQHVGSSTLHHPPLETLDDIDIQIRTVALRERIPILRGIFLQPVGSGYSVGACNWVISDATMSVGLVGPSCTAAKRHPAALDKQQLQMCSALVFRNLSAETESPNDRLNQFGSFLASTIARGGSVVVPVRLNGILFDLIEITSKVLRRTNMHAPIFLVSPQGKQALAFANAYCMWLSKEKQKPLYSANWPFNHHNLVETGRLRLFESITDPEFHRAFREPCIIFADDPGLRFGPVVRAIELIKSSPNSALVLVEADLHAEAALARFQPLRCQVMQFTIDPRLRTQEVARLVNDSNAQIVIAPTAIPLQGRPRECRLLRAGETHTIEPETPLTVTSALMDPQLLARLKPNQTLTDVAGVLSVRDYEYLLRADDVHHRDDDQHPAKRPRRPSLAALIAAFHMAGEFDLHVRRRGTTYKVSCAALGATISVEGTQTSVEIEDTGRYHDDSVGEEEGKGEDVKDVKAEVTDERGEPTAGPATIAMKTEDDEEEHEQQQQQQQQQYTQASSRTWRSSALRERLQHFLMESPARPFVEQQQQQQLQQQQQQQQFRGGLSSRQVGAVSPSAAASRAGSFLESHVRDDAADADDEEEEEDDDLASVQGTTGGSLVGSARAHDDSLNLSSTTGGNLAARHSGRGTADSANSSFTQRALNLSNASLSTTRDEMVAAMEHRIMALEAEKIDMHAAKLHAEHELKAVKAQLEREQIELARQRDAREKDSSEFSSRLAGVERQRDFLLEQVERLDKELKDTLESLTKAEQQHHTRMKDLHAQMQSAREALAKKEAEVTAKDQQRLAESHKHKRRELELEGELKTTAATVKRLRSKLRTIEEQRAGAGVSPAQATATSSSSSSSLSPALVSKDAVGEQQRQEQRIKELERRLAVAVEEKEDAEKHHSGQHLRTIRRLQDEVRQLKQGRESAALYKEKLASAQKQLQRKTEQLANLETQTHDYDDLKAFHTTWRKIAPFVRRFLFSDDVSEDQVLESLRTMQSDLLLCRNRAQQFELESKALQQKLSSAHAQLEQAHTKESEMKASVSALESRAAALERQCQYLRSERDKVQDLSMKMVEHQESFSKATAEQKVSKHLKEYQEHHKKLEAEMLRLQGTLAEREKELERLKRERDSAMNTDADEPATAAGETVDPRRTKILHLKSNPIAWAEEARKTEISRLKQERDHLREQLAKGAASTAGSVVDPKLQDRVKELEREVEQRDIRLKRLKEVFNNNVREFREACYELLGYQIDVVQASRYRLHSMYAESADDYLLFASSPQGLQLLETQFSASLDERILANLHRFHSIPAFLSAITVDLFSKSTMA